MYAPEQISVWLNTPTWVRIALLNFLRLEYKRVLGGIGVLKIDLPITFETSILHEDAIVEIWRGRPGAQYLDTETVWLVRDWDFALNDQGEEIIQVTAYDANFVLDSRIVAYKSGTANANKSGAADDVMKAYVREQFTTATDTARLISYFQVQPDLTLGPTVSRTAPHDKLIATLQEISQDASDQGILVYFDTVCPQKGLLEFRTYIGRRGNDHSASGGQRVVLSPSVGTLASVRRSYQTNQERNAVYVGGRGEESARNVPVVQDTDRQAISPFNRREMFINRNNTADANLVSEGQTILRSYRPREVFTLKVADNPTVPYGYAWGFGDIVSAEYRGVIVNARVEGIKTLVSGGKITTEAEVMVEDG